MQAPKSPEKTVRVRKTEKSQPNTTVKGKGGDVFDGTTKTVRLNQHRNTPNKTEIKPKIHKKQTSEHFYNEEQPENFLYDEDDLYVDESRFTELLNGSQARNPNNFQYGEQKSKKESYPDLINKMLVLCVNEKDFIKGTCPGRIKSHYQKVFQQFKDKMEPRDKAIINSGLNYIYNFNRTNSIPKENAIWLISIKEIPISHIVSYTSKNTLKEIAKEYGISCSNKKAEDLVVTIRAAIEKN
jgi:hypothetical protein